MLPSCGHYSYVAVPELLSCHHHELVNPEHTWPLCTCYNDGHVVVPALKSPEDGGLLNPDHHVVLPVTWSLLASGMWKPRPSKSHK